MKKAKPSHQQEQDDQNVITIFLSGDLMTGRGIDQALPYSVDPQLYESYVKDAQYYLEIAEERSGDIPDPLSFDYIWGDGLEVLDEVNPDLRVINLETAVTTSSKYCQNKKIHYRMHPENAPLLTQAKIDMCALANNHILDWGQKGLRQTLKTLQSRGIKTAGAGNNAESALVPAVAELPQGRFLVFSYATSDAGIPLSWAATENRSGINLLQQLDFDTAEKVIKDINSFKKKKDRVVFSIHWGGNWGYQIPRAQRRFAHSLIDSGAVDLIHGHSSHHPKGIEVYKDRLIIYGCGDLINDYEGITGYESYRDDLSLLYFPTLDPSGSLQSLRMVTVKIEKFRLNHASKKDKKWLLLRLNNECQKLGTEVSCTDSYYELHW